MSDLRIVPVSHAAANAFVERIHRHNGRLPGSILRVGVADASGLVRGVAIAGLPKARLLCDGYTLEVSRVCTDGTKNACSMLYAACVRGDCRHYMPAANIAWGRETGAPS